MDEFDTAAKSAFNSALFCLEQSTGLKQCRDFSVIGEFPDIRLDCRLEHLSEVRRTLDEYDIRIPVFAR